MSPLRFVADIGGSVWFVLQRIGHQLGAVAAAAVAIVHGDFAGAKAIMRDMSADIAALDKQFDEFEDRLKNPPAPAKSEKPPDISGGHDDFASRSRPK